MKIKASRDREDKAEVADREAEERAWLAEHADAIRAYNERIDKHGTLLTPIWMKTDLR